jgi:hypothetical protein
MKKEFIYPDFSRKDLEVRFEDDTVCIYGTENGLKELIGACEFLIKNPEASHLHLDSPPVLTRESLKCVIAIFDKSGKDREKVGLFKKVMNMFK